MRATVCALTLFAANTALAEHALGDQWEKQWQVGPFPELRVDVGDGGITVHPGSGSTIEEHVTTTGWTIAPGAVTITERQEGNRVEIEVHVPHIHFGVNFGSREVRVDLTVPRQIASSFHTGDGAIDITGLHGSVEARTGDGSIEAVDVDGSFAGHTGDGHIHLRGRLDNLDLETGDGAIEAEAVPGSHVTSGWRVHTGDGHVTVRLPEECRADLDAHTGDGSITVDLPVTVQGVFKGRNDLNGKLNGGGESLTIHTGDGPIRIERS